MKSLVLTFFLSISSFFLAAQTEQDTAIHDVADVTPYPLLQSCIPERHPAWNGNADSIRRCAETQLFNVLAANIRYPEEARNNNLQGSVVVSLVVEPSTGRMTNLKLLKDIGGGCGKEALRILVALDEAGLRWQPAVLLGKPVRVRHALPIRFRLKEALPYYISTEGDTIYTDYDKAPDFKGGLDSLVKFLVNRLEYPAVWEDNCKVGVIEMATILKTDGSLKISNQLDFNNLGMDFQFEAIRLARRSAGMWIPAEYQGKPVATTLPLRVVFKSEAEACASVNANFDRTMILADEGATLLEQDKPEEAIQKWNEALALQPDNCELLYYRGTAHMNQNRREDACKDYNRVKELIGFTWFEEIRRLICGY
ncbi:MAG: energy transducer TonB [Saprospiraceae bacterium]|nr:energy transducer TonB [Saprospiraceae bacterium]